MTDSDIIIGVDLRDNVYYTARVLHGTGRLQVKALIRYEKDHLGDQPLLNNGKIIISVPESKTIVKKIKLNDLKIEDYKNRACFEILQSLPDNPDDYCCEILETGIKGTYLGLAAYNKDLETSIIDPFIKAANLYEKPGAQARGIALGKGYITFCHQEGGDLAALVDIYGKMVSICFVFKRNIVSIANMQLKKADLTNEVDLNSFAVELKTLINFHLNSIFYDNVTLPLSAVLISGLDSLPLAMPILNKYFQVKVGQPRLNHGYFAEPEKMTDVPIEKYLVALGLTIN